MKQISWLDRATNEEVLRKANEERHVLNSSRVQYLLSWFTLLGTSLLVILLSQLIFSIVLHIHISQQSTEGKSIRKSKEHP